MFKIQQKERDGKNYRNNTLFIYTRMNKYFSNLILWLILSISTFVSSIHAEQCLNAKGTIVYNQIEPGFSSKLSICIHTLVALKRSQTS